MSHKKIMPILLAWSVHAFTGSAAFFGILAIIKIFRHEYIAAFWCMGITVVIDALDGTLARLVGVKKILPNFDGALLDNLVDFLNYVIVPCVFLYTKADMVVEPQVLWIIFAIAMTSSYQFCQADAKTPDHFFKGFPCYWNFAVFYMFIFDTSMHLNTWILYGLCVLVFVPIKYVYPSRLDFLTESKQLKMLMHGCSLIYAASSILILWFYPHLHPIWLGISFGYIMLYLMLSMYRSYFPLLKAKILTRK